MRPKSNVVYPMTHKEVTKIAEKVLKKNPDSIRKYARGEKKALTFCYLAGMVLNAYSYKADPQMIDQVLHERLQHVNILNRQRSTAQGKENVQLNRQRSTAQGKENVQLNWQRSTTQGKENVQVGEQSTPMTENEITSQCSKEPSIVRRVNFDQREQLNCIQRVRKDPSLPSMPSSLNEGVFGDNCKRVMRSICNQRVQNSLSATKRKEVDTSNFQPTIDLPKKQATQKPVQNQSLLPQGDRAEIEKLVNKVIEENPDMVKSFRNPRRREFAHCFLGGMAFLEGKKKVDKDLLSKILYEKLFATLLKQPTGCNSGVNIFQ